MRAQKPYYIWLAFLTNSILIGAWAARIPEFKAYFQTENGIWGMVLLIIPLFSLVASFPTGKLIRHFNLATILRWGIFLSLVSFVLLPFTKNFLLFLLVLVAYGLSSGMLNLAMNAAAGAYEHQTGKPIMAASHGMYSFGGMLGSGFGVVAGSLTLSTQTFFGVLTLVLFLCNVYLIKIVLPKEPMAEQHKEKVGWSRYLVLLALTSFVFMSIEGMILNWSGLFLKTEAATSAGLVSAGFLAFSATMTLGRWAGNQFFSRFSVRQLMTFGSGIVVIGFALLWMSQQFITATAAFAVIGLGASALVPLLFSEATKFQNPPPETAIAVVLSVGIAGIMTGAPLIGFASELLGLRNAMLIPLGLTGLILLAQKGFPHKKTPQTS